MPSSHQGALVSGSHQRPIPHKAFPCPRRHPDTHPTEEKEEVVAGPTTPELCCSCEGNVVETTRRHRRVVRQFIPLSSLYSGFEDKKKRQGPIPMKQWHYAGGSMYMHLGSSSVAGSGAASSISSRDLTAKASISLLPTGLTHSAGVAVLH